MTWNYKHDLGIPTTYLNTPKINFPGQGFQKSEHYRQTRRQMRMKVPQCIHGWQMCMFQFAFCVGEKITKIH